MRKEVRHTIKTDFIPASSKYAKISFTRIFFSINILLNLTKNSPMKFKNAQNPAKKAVKFLPICESGFPRGLEFMICFILGFTSLFIESKIFCACGVKFISS